MLIVKKLNEKTLGVFFKYANTYINRIHDIESAKFHKKYKMWTIDVNDFNKFRKIFKGEIAYSTPEHILTNKPPKNYKDFYGSINQYTLNTTELKPFNYQKYGVDFMIDRIEKFGLVINADDVGLGKTAQSLFAANYLKENKKLNKILVVCKKSLKEQWKEEGFEKFTKLSSFVIESTTKKKREKNYLEFVEKDYDALIINYELIMSDFEKLKELKFDTIIIDEVHKIAQRTGKKNKLFMKLIKDNIKASILLTGTPIESKPEDLYSILKLGGYDKLAKWKDFEKEFITKELKGKGYSKYWDVVGFKNIDKLKKEVKPLIIRRTVDEVDKEMPKILEPKIIKVDKDNIQIQVDDTISTLMFEVTKKIQKQQVICQKNTNNLEFKNELERLEGVQKGLILATYALANDPKMFKLSKSKFMKFVVGKEIPEDYKFSPKTLAVCDQVQEIVDDGKKVIIFSKYKTATDVIKSALQTYSIESTLYTGKTSDSDRKFNLKRFKTSLDINVLIGTDAMAEGLNIKEATHIIHYDLPHKNSILIQRNGRARRADSNEKHIFIYYFLTKGSKDIDMLKKVRSQNVYSNNIINANEEERIILKKINNR